MLIGLLFFIYAVIGMQVCNATLGGHATHHAKVEPASYTQGQSRFPNEEMIEPQGYFRYPINGDDRSGVLKIIRMRGGY